MNIKDTLAAINQMEADGVTKRYAIGGAVGATFCLEPVATLDVDIFIDFHPTGGNLLVSPLKRFSAGTDCRRRGSALKNNSLATLHDL